MISDSAAHRTVCICFDGGPNLDKRVDSDSPSPSFVDKPDRCGPQHRDFLDRPTVETVRVAADPSEEHVCKILLLGLIGTVIDKERDPPGTPLLVVGIRANQYD
jgi:hypothetical protein